MSNPLKGTRPVFVKTVSVLTSVATMLSLSGAAYLAPLTAIAAVPSDYGLTEGNTISATGSNDPDIYIVNELGYKRLFLNPVIFSFYGHLGGFAKVKSVSSAARDAFPTTQLFRNCETNAQAVYAVEVTGEDTATLHHVAMTGAQAVAEDANFFKKVFCVNNNEATWYSMGSAYTSLSQIPPYVRDTTPTPSVGLSVSLASNNPAAGTLVKSQAAADLAHFTFSGTGIVSNLKFDRIGVSADTDLVNVYLYDGIKRLTDAATVTNSVISFNDTSAEGLFMVSGSRTISVRADLSSSTGNTVGVRLTSWNGNAVSLSGNLFTVANATLGTTVFTNSATPSTNSALDPANDVKVWQDNITVGTRYSWLQAFQARVIGSVYVGDLKNFRLYVDGIQAGSALSQSDANGYLVFDMGSGVKLETGTRTLKILADVVNGSSRNFTVSVRQASDLFTVDSQYNQPILATVNTGSFPVSAGQQTISSGTLSITKTTDSTSGTIVKGASGIALARFELKAAGESMKVENLRISNTSAPEFALRNGALFVDGVQIGSTQTIWEDSTISASNSTAYTQYSLGSSLVVVPGTPKILEIRADVFDASGNNDVANGATIAVNVAIGSSNVQKVTSLGYLSTPASAVAGNSLTVGTGSLTAGKFTGYANQSVVAPKTGVKIGHFTLAAASAEDIAINTLTFDAVPIITASLSGDFSDAYVKVWNDVGAVIYTSPVKTTFAIASSNSYAVNFTLPKNKTYQVELWTNVNSTFDTTGTADVVTTNFDAAGTTVGSSTAASAAQATGQTITSATGSLTQANSSVPTAQFRVGGSTATGYQFTLTPAYDDYYLEEVYVDLSSIVALDTNAVATLTLKDGATTLATATINSTTSSASFTGMNLLMSQINGTKTLTVDVQFSNVGVGAATTNGTVKIQLDGLKYRNSSGSITTTNGLATTNSGNNNVVVKGFPTFTNSALPTIVLAGGSQTLFKTVVTATGGQIGWNNIVFTVSSTSAAATFGPNAAGWKLFENGVDITPSDTGATASVSDVGSTTRVEFDFATERVITSATPVTLELRTTVGGTVLAGESVTTSIANPTASTVTATTSALQAVKSATFIWTDQSAVSHGTGTSDWFTDGLVMTLAQSQTLTK